MTVKRLLVFADGGSRGNPGPAAIGFVVKDLSGKVIKKEGKLIGQTTNNVAEYLAVIEALKWIKTQPTQSVDSIDFFLDSKLIINQLNGLYKIKDAKLRNLIIKVRQLERDVGGNVSYRHISREKNKEADALVNQSFEKP